MIKIGIIGFGNVGQGVFNILKDNSSLLKQRIGQDLEIKTIAVRSPDKYKDFDLGNATLTTRVEDILEDPEISIVVELMGGEYPAFDYICTALKAGKYVVTANKEVVSKHKKTFFELAKENHVDIYFEAAVAGGIPIIRSLKVGFAANRINSLYGILNGTTNYILTKIEDNNQEFAEVLAEAQELGLAEADPHMDIAGVDAAHKLVILAAVAFKVDISIEDLFYEGIEQISLVDILYAKELGYRIKLLAIAKRLDNNKMSFKVHPTMIPLDHALANIKNEVNAVYIEGNAVGEALLAGKGAGGSPTGSAVVSDIIDIAFDTTKELNRRNLETDLEQVELQPIETTYSQFYIRLLLEDHSRVLEKITGILGQHDVSISKLLQKESKDGSAEVVIITHTIQEIALNTAIKEIKEHDDVKELNNVIRVRLDEN